MCNHHFKLDKEGDDNSDSDNFPWHLGLADTHCHPLEYPASLSTTSLSKIKTETLAVLATRLEDQSILHEIALEHRKDGKNSRIIPGFGWHPWFSHLLYDDLGDNTEDKKELTDDQILNHYSQVLTPPPTESFIKCLPSPTRLSSALSQLRNHLLAHPLALIGEVGLDKAFRIPEPWPDGIAPDQPPYSEPPSRPHVAQIEESGTRDDKGDRTPGGRWRRGLSKHRVSMAHQKKVLLEQLKIAAELSRVASVHGVQAHGALFDVFKELCESDEQYQKEKEQKREQKTKAKKNKSKPNNEPSIEMPTDSKDTVRSFPPKVCLHSYSGSPSSLFSYYPNKSSSDSLPIEFYISVSTPNNFRTSLSQMSSGGEIDTASVRAIECIKFVPPDRILVESDMHSAGREADDMLADVIRRVCIVKEWELEEGIKILQANWKAFALGEDHKS